MFKVSDKVASRILDMAATKLAARVAAPAVDRHNVEEAVADRLAASFTESRYEMQSIRNRVVETLVDAVDAEEIKGDVVEYLIDNHDFEGSVVERLIDNAETDVMTVAERAALILAEKVSEAIDAE